MQRFGPHEYRIVVATAAFAFAIGKHVLSIMRISARFRARLFRLFTLVISRSEQSRIIFHVGVSRYESNDNYTTWWIEHFSSASVKRSLGTNYGVIIMPDSRALYVYTSYRRYFSLSLSLFLHHNGNTEYFTSETTLIYS